MAPGITRHSAWAPMNRWLLAGMVLVASLAATQGNAQAQARPPPIPLWAGGAPGALGTAATDVPSISLYRPSLAATGRAAMVVCPGGAYAGLADHEGHDAALWLNALGITAAVLKYRLGPRYHHPSQVQDAARAVRLLRTHAREWGIDAGRIGVWGFSAGGHLASTLATRFDDGNPGSDDPVERVSSRPDLAVLAYPVITMADGLTHRGSRRNLLGTNPPSGLIAELSNETRVTARTPPTFIFHTADDKEVAVDNSLLFSAALRAAAVPHELHVFETGRHGVGLAKDDPGLSVWPALLKSWLGARGFLR